MQHHLNPMQLGMRVGHVALELATIEAALFKLSINSVDLVRHCKEIAADWRF